MMVIMLRLQMEAPLLKSLPDTKVIAVGIGNDVDQSELKIIASSPQNVFLAQDFNSLTSIERQMLDEICGKHARVICCRAKLSVYQTILAVIFYI